MIVFGKSSVRYLAVSIQKSETENNISLAGGVAEAVANKCEGYLLCSQLWCCEISPEMVDSSTDK
jgi:hypothetical protein